MMNANQFLGMVGILCGTLCGTVITLFTLFQKMPMPVQVAAGGSTAAIAAVGVAKGLPKRD